MGKEAERRALTAGILTIGNEVLDGIVLDTNSNWLAVQLTSLGLTMTRQAIVRDSLIEIGQGIDFLRGACDIVITSGGLGPTYDDMTLEAVAMALRRDRVRDERAVEIVTRQYRYLYEKGIVDTPEMTESRLKMARIPKGSVALDNTVGGAPGVYIQEEDVAIFCLPGVPSELKMIFEDSVKTWIKENAAGVYYEETYEFDIADESIFAPYIDVAMGKHPEVYIKSMPKTYGTSRVLRVWISSRGTERRDLITYVKSAVETLKDVSRLSARKVRD